MPVSDGYLSSWCLTMLLRYERYIIFHGAVGSPGAIIMRLVTKARVIHYGARIVRSFGNIREQNADLCSTSDQRFAMHRFARFIDREQRFALNVSVLLFVAAEPV